MKTNSKRRPAQGELHALRQTSALLVAKLLHVLFLAGVLTFASHPVLAAASLTLSPITWNIIGLDSNNVNVGPNHFPVGARVCNTGDAPATNLTGTF